MRANASRMTEPLSGCVFGLRVAGWQQPQAGCFSTSLKPGGSSVASERSRNSAKVKSLIRKIKIKSSGAAEDLYSRRCFSSCSDPPASPTLSRWKPAASLQKQLSLRKRDDVKGRFHVSAPGGLTKKQKNTHTKTLSNSIRTSSSSNNVFTRRRVTGKHLCGVDSAYCRRWLRPAALWSGRADRYKLALWCCDALKAWRKPRKKYWAAAVRQRLHLKGSDVLVCECVSVELVGDVTQCPPTCSKHGPGPHMTPPSTCVCESLLLFPSLTQSSYSLSLD